jgi:hypothetical protein
VYHKSRRTDGNLKKKKKFNNNHHHHPKDKIPFSPHPCPFSSSKKLLLNITTHQKAFFIPSLKRIKGKAKKKSECIEATSTGLHPMHLICASIKKVVWLSVKNIGC